MAEEKYVLATGAEGAYRLRIVNSVHGPDTQAFLRRSGVQPGMRVLDLGCGIGTISCWLAEAVGVTGEVMGVDVSEGQIEQARQNAQVANLTNTRFVHAGAYETGLPSDSFDLVFSRFVLMHLQRPDDALREMRRVLKPGGILAVEDGDFGSPFCYPPNAAYDRCFELYRQAGAQHGEDFYVGTKLYHRVRDAGFADVQAHLVQPAFTRGDAKRLPEWTLEEIAPNAISAGLTTSDEIQDLIAELQRIAQDESSLFAMARMMQVYAHK